MANVHQNGQNVVLHSRLTLLLVFKNAVIPIKSLSMIKALDIRDIEALHGVCSSFTQIHLIAQARPAGISAAKPFISILPPIYRKVIKNI